MGLIFDIQFVPLGTESLPSAVYHAGMALIHK